MNIATITGLLKLVDEYSPVMAKVASSVQQSGAKMDAVGRQMSESGRRLSLGLTAPIVAMAGAAIKASIDFESSFAGVRKTVNATEAEFKALSTGFRQMSKEIPVNVNELNRIGEAAGQLGIETKNILSFTRVMADLGVATNLSSEQAATSLARLANITQMPQTEFQKLGSTIVALGNNFATTESEIVEMGLRIAGAGKQIGLTEHQIMGVAAALSSVGIEAQAGGSAISKVMIDMASAVETGGTHLKLYSKIAGVDFAKAFKDDASKALVTFIAGLKDTERHGMSTLGALDKLGVSEVRMRDALLRASGAGDLMNRTLQVGAQAWTENNALTKEAEQRYATTASKLTIFWNKVKDVAITLGDTLLPALTNALTKAEPLLQWAVQAAAWFGSLPQPIQMTAFAILGLLAVIGPLLFALGNVLSVTGLMIGGFGRFIGIAPKAVTGFTTIGNAAGVARLAILGVQGAIAALSVMAIAKFISEAIGLFNDLERHRAQILSDNKRHAEALSIASKIAGREIVDLAEASRVVNEHNIAQRIAKGHHEIGEMRDGVYSLTLNVANLGGALEKGKSSLDGVGAVVEQKTTPAVNGLSAEMQELVDGALEGFAKKGKEAIAVAMAWAARIRQAGDVTKLTASQQADLHDALTDVVDEYGSLKAAGLGSLQAILDKTDALVGKTAALRAQLVGFSSSDIQRVQLMASGSGGAFGAAAALASSALVQRPGGLTLQQIAEKRRRDQGMVDAGGDMGGTFGQAAAFASRLQAMGNVLAFNRKPSAASIERDWGMVQAGGDMGGIFGQAAAFANRMQQMGKVLQFKKPTTVGDRFGDVMGEMPGTILGAIQGGGSVSGSIGSSLAGFGAKELVGKFSAKFAGSALGKLASGALSSALPLVGGLIGPAITGLIGKMFGGEKKEAKAMVSSFVEQMGGLTQLTKLAREAGVSLDALMSAKKKNTAQAEIDKIAAALKKQQEETERLERALDRYGLSWKDAGEAARAAKIGEIAQELIADHDLLVKKGYDTSKVIAGMSGALNTFLNQALTTNTKIPASMRPMLESLIKAGKLTEENARLLLGMEASGVPSFAAVKDAADRYGISIDALGPKVKQLEINESAQQIVADFELMVAAGGDVGAILDGMKGKAQGYIDSALQGFIEIPSAMKPMLEQMVAAGLLTDANGDKLKDLSGIKFAEPLSEAVDRLLAKLDELIDTLSGKVEKAMGDATRDRVFKWKGQLEVDGNEPDAGGGLATPGFAGGTGGRYLDFGAGTRVTLHGRERVMTEAEGRRGGGGSGSSGPITIQLVLPNGQVLAETVLEEMPDAARRLGVA